MKQSKRRLHSALDAISRELLASVPLGRDTPRYDAHAGLAIASFALEEALPGRGHADRAGWHLGRAIDALGRTAAPPWLFGGFTGVAWTTEILCGAPAEGEPDPNEDVDAEVERLLRVKRWKETYDVIGGLVGFGVYALERAARPSARVLLTRVVDHLEATAVELPEGIAWRPRAAWVSKQWRTETSDGWNLGVAHGVPGVVAFLGRAQRAGIEQRRVERLLEGAVQWLLAQELPRKSAASFGYSFVDGGATSPARAAWCYGDPGVASALFVAARAAGEKRWERAAVRIAAKAAVRPAETCGVVDAGLCHGAAGLAHMFHRFFRETRDPRFATAADAWLDRALAMREPGKGVAGFRSLLPRGSKPGAPLTWHRDTSFLAGSPGIVAALASFAVDDEKGDWAAWDRALLLSDLPASSS